MKKERESLDIIIPTFNRKNHINRLVKLILKQIKKIKFKTNILVSDNNSQDNTFAALQKIKNRHFYLYKQKKNIGATKNFLYLLRKSKSTFVLTLGDDDLLNIKTLNKIFDSLNKKNNVACCVTPIRVIDVKTRIRSEKFRQERLPSQIIKCNNLKFEKFFLRGLTFAGLFFKRSCLISKRFQYVESMYPQLFFLGLAFSKGDCLYLNQPLVEVSVGNPANWEYNIDYFNKEIFRYIHIYSSAARLSQQCVESICKQRARNSFSMLWNVRVNKGLVPTLKCYFFNLKNKYYFTNIKFHLSLLFCLLFPQQLKNFHKNLRKRISDLINLYVKNGFSPWLGICR